METGEHIRKIRELRGFSQDYMANKLEISQRQYSRIEKEQTKIDLQKLQEISNLLEVTLIELLGFDEKKIFNQNHNQTATEVYNNYFPEELKTQYEKRILQLEEEVQFLRTIVKP